MKLLKCLPLLLCLCCAYSQEVTKEEIEQFRKAADQGDANAQCKMGFCYNNGEGVPEDNAEAVKWFRKAADQGVAIAQGMMGLCYNYGKGVPQDNAEAVKWFRKAADQGLANAQFNLANCYGKGEGVPEDYIAAYMWLNLAAAQGYELAKKNKDLIAECMTKEQIAEAQKLSREWQERFDKTEKK